VPKSSHHKSKEEEEDDKEVEKKAHHNSHHGDKDDDDMESERKTHYRHKDEDDDEESTHSRSSHSHSVSHEERKPHLSGAAKMLQRIQSQGSDEARLGRVASVRGDDSSRHSYLWSGVAVVAIAAAFVINRKTFEMQDDNAVERIPLVVSSSSISDSPNKSATWQQEALARRGVRYGDEFDEP
jgi:hypothetical protein